MSEPGPLLPKDKYNQQLEANVHPNNWINPTPEGRYNLVVIGAGTAGLVTAAGAAGLGAKVALVERNLMGGDCLNVGCVPSKGLISAARAANAVQDAQKFGVRVPQETHVDFASVMQRIRRLRSHISLNDSATRFKDLGVDVFFGEGKFVDSDCIEVNSTRLVFRRAVIASGGRAAPPPLHGLDQVDYLTNESVFSLTELPPRLGVIGAGPMGCELAQSFARLGSQVHLFTSERGILPREDRQAAGILSKELEKDRVHIYPTGKRLELQKRGACIGVTAAGEKGHDIVVDHLLVAVGRTANVEHLNLQVAGVQHDQRGVQVNARLQTTNPRIYAAGDVCSPHKFTHAADFMARIVIQNALFAGRTQVSNLVIPWCTYTSPEIGRVGLNETEARDHNVEIDTYVQELKDIDRAVLEGSDAGFVKVHVAKNTDRILGATIVANNAGDMISEITLAMKHRIGLRGIARTIHPYPTQAEAIRKIGDQYNRTRLTPTVKSLLKQWLSWTR